MKAIFWWLNDSAAHHCIPFTCDFFHLNFHAMLDEVRDEYNRCGMDEQAWAVREGLAEEPLWD
jgi:hypothetical protein